MELKLPDNIQDIGSEILRLGLALIEDEDVEQIIHTLPPAVLDVMQTIVDYQRLMLLKQDLTKKWIGSKECNICHRIPSAVGATCYDSPTSMGSWAFMCRQCWLNFGFASGQEYDAKTLIKIQDL